MSHPGVARLCVGAALGLLTFGAASAERTQQTTFRAGVRLLLLDVTVVDDRGQPITELGPADFSVRIDDVDRKVQAAEWLDWSGVVSSPDLPGAFETRPRRPPRSYLILVDDLSFRPDAGRDLRAAGERFLQRIDPDDQVGLTTTSGLGPTVSPSRDRAAIREAIAKAAGRDTHSTEPFFIAAHEAVTIARDFDQSAVKAVVARECALVSVGMQCDSSLENMARGLAIDLQRRLESQLGAIRHAVTAMAAAPAPRVVVVLTAGLAVEAAPDMPLAMTALSGLASSAGVQLYALAGASGAVEGNIRDRTELRAAARRREGVVLTEGIQTVATAAGGAAFRVVGTADRLLDRIIAETSGVYRLGIEVDEASLSKPLRAKVSVRRRGAVVRTTGRPRDPDLTTPTTSVSAPGSITSIPVIANARIRARKGADVEILAEARLSGSAKEPARLVFTLLAAGGAAVFAAQRNLSGTPAATGHHVAIAIPTAPGRYRLRVEIIGADGERGQTEIAVDAALTRTATMALSDILLSIPDSAGTNRFWGGDELPGDAQHITAVVELYPTSWDLLASTVTFRITDSEDKIVAEATAAPTRTAANSFTAAARFDVTSLPPGEYRLRADVLRDGESAATQTRRVIKR